MDITPRDETEKKALGHGARIAGVIGIIGTLVPTLLAAVGGLDFITAHLPMLLTGLGSLVTGGLASWLAIRRMRIDAGKLPLLLLLLVPAPAFAASDYLPVRADSGSLLAACVLAVMISVATVASDFQFGRTADIWSRLLSALSGRRGKISCALLLLLPLFMLTSGCAVVGGKAGQANYIGFACGEKASSTLAGLNITETTTAKGQIVTDRGVGVDSSGSSGEADIGKILGKLLLLGLQSQGVPVKAPAEDIVSADVENATSGDANAPVTVSSSTAPLKDEADSAQHGRLRRISGRVRRGRLRPAVVLALPGLPCGPPRSGADQPGRGVQPHRHVDGAAIARLQGLHRIAARRRQSGRLQAQRQVN